LIYLWVERNDFAVIPTPPSSISTATSLPPIAPGSTRYFVQLYCPAARRDALATLLAVADEIGAGLSRQIDHSVAHARLEWWRQETQRFGRAAPAHPWLRAWLRASPADCSLELEALTDAAAIDLANQRLGDCPASELTGALFTLAARLLAEGALTHESEPSLRALGQYTAELESAAFNSAASDAPTATPAATLKTSARSSAPQVNPALQPPIVPLLVWAALAERKAVRRRRRTLRERRHGQSTAREPAGRLDLLTDNFIAWRAARAALRGRYRFE
jgi:hypothetical protein